MRELRLALSRAGASYLRAVGQVRIRVAVERRGGSFTGRGERGGFTTTLVNPGG